MAFATGRATTASIQSKITTYSTLQQLNTDQWVLAAKEAGCKFAVLTATHETGFGLWQSDVNPYCLKAVKWRDGKGDVVRDFVQLLP